MRAIPSSRRRFLVGSASMTAGLLLPRRARSQPAPARPLVPRETFFGDPDVASAQLSFDGAWVSYVAPVDGVRNLWVAPVGDLGSARPLTRATDRPISSFAQWAYTHRHIVFFQERDGDENWRASSVDIHDGTIVPLTPPRGVRCWLQEVSQRFPGEMLFSHNERDKRFFDLHRVDVVTGKSALLFENHRFAWLVTDSAFQPRLGSRYLKDGSVEILERRPSGTWMPFMSIQIGEVDAHAAPRLQRRRQDALPLRHARTRQGRARGRRHGDPPDTGAGRGPGRRSHEGAPAPRHPAAARRRRDGRSPAMARGGPRLRGGHESDPVGDVRRRRSGRPQRRREPGHGLRPARRGQPGMDPPRSSRAPDSPALQGAAGSRRRAAAAARAGGVSARGTA